MTEAMEQGSITTVGQVVLHERQSRDRGWWELMGRTYWPDSTVRLSWYDGDGPGFVLGSKSLAEQGVKTVHRSFSAAVHVRDEKAFVEVPVEVLAPIVVEDVPGRLIAHSRLNYGLERRNGEWRISSLEAVYEQTSIAPDAPGSQISIPADELAPFRESYAILAWDIARRGQTMADDFLGDDRPDKVAQFYADMWDWLTH